MQLSAEKIIGCNLWEIIIRLNNYFFKIKEKGTKVVIYDGRKESQEEQRA